MLCDFFICNADTVNQTRVMPLPALIIGQHCAERTVYIEIRLRSDKFLSSLFLFSDYIFIFLRIRKLLLHLCLNWVQILLYL